MTFVQLFFYKKKFMSLLFKRKCNMVSKKLSTDNLDIIFFDLNKKWESYNKKKMLENVENTGINLFFNYREFFDFPKSMIFKSGSELVHFNPVPMLILVPKSVPKS
jgi:hypothetical protein